jgi:UDP-glucose 4-epimerase
MSRIVVTGAAGFVGSHLVDRLTDLGHEVWGIDHHLREKKRFPNPHVTMVKVSFADQSVTDLLYKIRPDIVYHLAAQISVTASVEDPLRDAKCNLFDATRFLQSCCDVGVKKFVFASSGGAIYGDHHQQPIPLLDDASPECPYGVSKLAFERVVKHVASQSQMDYAILRFANLFGPRQQLSRPLAEGNVFAVFLDRLIVTGEPLIIFGDGSSTRDYVYIDDVIEALTRAGLSDFSGTVHVSSGLGISVQTVVDKLLNIHGHPHNVVYKPFRSGEIMYSALDPMSAKQMLQWAPRVAFDDGLKQMYDWYLRTFGT